jgi:hypothetical protein
VDLSGLIFVALAVAWAAYLIPKALRHHDDVVRGRSIDRFSHSMRVLARREPVNARQARLVETHAGGPPTVAEPIAVPLSADDQYAARRAATHRATRRRRRVLAVLLLAVVAVLGGAVTGRLAWTYATVPAGLLIAWLVACRLMVRKEQAWQPATMTEEPSNADTTTGVAVDAEPPAKTSPPDPRLWDPVPVTLPTYVSKPAARRSVRTIDLDATGVWTSGRTESDSALAREADAAEAAERVRRRATRKDESGDEAVSS